MMRLQALLRPWGTMSDQGRTDGKGAVRAGDPRLTMVYGVVEGDAREPEEGPDAMHALWIDRGLTVCETAPPIEGAIDDLEFLKTGPLHAALTERVWQGGEGASRIAGRILTRPCGLDGGRARLVLGILTGGAVTEPTWIEASGTGSLTEGGRLLVESRPGTAPTNGSCPDEAFKTPQWGWDETPVGFQTTLRLEIADLVDAFHRLPMPDERNEEEARRAAKIEAATGGIVSSLRLDGEYARYMAALRRQPGWSRRPTRRPLTAKEIASKEAIAVYVIRSLRDDAA